MIRVRISAFHLDRLPKCKHGRVLCRACGLDPFEQSHSELSDRQGGGIFNHGEVMDNG